MRVATAIGRMTAATADRAASTVVLRSGGLGDFLLALPLLAALRQAGATVTLLTRSAYARLLAGGAWCTRAWDIDGALAASLWTTPAPELATALAGARVISFLPDGDGALAAALQRAGVAEVAWLPSRPATPPHVAAQALMAAGLPVPDALLTTAHLARQTTPAAPCLWLHPGSGSAAKNVPLPWLAARSRAWLAEHPDGRLVVSYGEADLALQAPLAALLAGLPVHARVLPDLSELRDCLAAEATAFLGADTGVTHLAAALGIATEVLFVSTDPAIWRPLGPAVRVCRWHPGLDPTHLPAEGCVP